MSPSKIWLSRLLPLLAALSFFAWTASAGMLDGPPQLNVKGALGEYKDLRQFTIQLLRKYPPDQYVYVGLGRSPTPFIGLAKALLGEGAAVNLPLSSMEGWERDGISRSGQPRRITTRMMERLRTHFDHFVPSESTLNGRRILLVDFAESGGSLKNSLRELRSYLQLRGRKTEAVGLAIPQDQHAMERLHAFGLAWMEAPKELRNSIIRTEYKSLAEYGNFEISPRNAESDYRAPPRQTREFHHEEKRRWLKSVHFAGDPQQKWVIERKAAYQADIDQAEGFDTLLSAYRERARRDRPLLEAVAALAPNAEILNHLPPAAPGGACAGWFEKLRSLLRLDRLPPISP